MLFLTFFMVNHASSQKKSTDFIGNVLELAQFFFVQDIKESCLSELALRISPDTLKQITEIATKLNLQELFNICSWKSTAEFISSPSSLYRKTLRLQANQWKNLQKSFKLTSTYKTRACSKNASPSCKSFQTEETDVAIASLAKQYGLITLLPTSKM